jgi:hypothetical protein
MVIHCSPQKRRMDFYQNMKTKPELLGSDPITTRLHLNIFEKIGNIYYLLGICFWALQSKKEYCLFAFRFANF